MNSHAANPFAVRVNQSIFRIYFTCRDELNRSHIGSVDMDFEDNFKIINMEDTPVVAPGDLGYFDDSGVAMGYYMEHENKKLLYYLGWNLKVTVPWQNSIGLCIYDDKLKRFKKSSRAPILDRSDEDPFSISYPSVLFENGEFKMWYGSNLSWGKDQSEMNHVIKYATSKDGIHWNRTNDICIGLMHPNEYALSKPLVIMESDLYRMWYSYRGNGAINTYRIGYADSKDGIHWKRKDEWAGIDVAPSGWDSEMICYPFVFHYKNKLHMLYNGNGYGKTGFGLAIEDGRY